MRKFLLFTIVLLALHSVSGFRLPVSSASNGDPAPAKEPGKYNPSVLPLKETAVPQFGCTIQLPEGMKESSANEYSVTYTLTYPDGLTGATIHLSRQPVYFPTLESAVEMATSFTGGDIKDRQKVGENDYLIVKNVNQLGQQEIWYFAKGHNGYISASCLAEAGYESYFLKIVRSLKAG